MDKFWKLYLRSNLIAIIAWVFGAYMVWMHNSSLVNKN